MSPPAVWDNVAIEILTRMWAEGASAGMISNELMSKGYNFTRNAVIGKKARLKLPPPSYEVQHQVLAMRKQRSIVAGKIAAKPQLFVHRKPQSLGAQAAVLSNPTERGAMLLTECEDGHCRAIIGYVNGELAKAIVCGESTPFRWKRGKLIRGSWCQYHNELYIQEDRPHR